MKRKICVVITARPSYSRVKTVLQSINQKEDLELQLVVTASALLDRYGSAIKTIQEDGFNISAKAYTIIEGDSLENSAKTTGLGIIELSSIFSQLQPDIVVSIADRFETIATAISASYMNIPLAHIQGGEITGNIDEKVRHAVTKLSDYHFVSSIDAYNRVIKLGEDKNFVFNTGCPSIDIAANLTTKNLSNTEFDNYGGVGAKIDIMQDFIVVLQHPVTTEVNNSRKHIEATLEAIKDVGLPCVWFWPNVDSGSDGTSKGIRSFREQNPKANIFFIKNMHPNDFLRLLRQSKCLIGNSSVGIRECSFLGIPVVNIGNRQNRRERGPNVVDVNPNKDDIVAAIISSISAKKPGNSNIYGAGDAGKKIADILSEVKLKFHKTINY